MFIHILGGERGPLLGQALLEWHFIFEVVFLEEHLVGGHIDTFVAVFRLKRRLLLNHDRGLGCSDQALFRRFPFTERGQVLF